MFFFFEKAAEPIQMAVLAILPIIDGNRLQRTLYMNSPSVVNRVTQISIHILLLFIINYVDNFIIIIIYLLLLSFIYYNSTSLKFIYYFCCSCVVVLLCCVVWCVVVFFLLVLSLRH